MTQPSTPPDRLAFVGFGEAATAFLTGWGEDRPRVVSAYDIKTAEGATRDGMLARYGRHAVEGADTPAGALERVEVVFCLVTADQALAAAEAAAPHIAPGTLWLDGNSCAPGTKRRAAEVIARAGGRHVDMAIMAPVHPARHRVPLLVSGPDAGDAEAVLRTLGMRPKCAGDEVGQASAIKMLRSVMVKGLEALTAECFLAARRAGVEEQVIASLEASDPDVAWRARGAYNLDRMMTHGRRRAAEMHEAARTVDELGLPGVMSEGAADWQTRIAEAGAAPEEDEDLFTRADRILAGLV